MSFDTGLAVYARRRMGTVGVLYSMARMSRKRPRIGRLGRARRHDLPGFVLRADEPVPFQVDGDLLEPREKVKFRSVPQALRVLI